MREEQTREVRVRRSRGEVERLVAEYEASGMRQAEFCRKHGIALATLSRYRKRRGERVRQSGEAQWVAVELSAAQRTEGGRSAGELTVLLASGRRIEVRGGFDAATLQHLVRVLEQG